MADLPALLDNAGALRNRADPHGTGPDPKDVAGSFAKETKRAYASDWRIYDAWCRAHGVAPIPATAKQLADFLKDQAERAGRSMSTVLRRLSSIAQIHNLAGQPINRRDPTLVYAIRRLSREFKLMQTGKAELMTADLEAMIARLPRGKLASARDKALVLVGFAGGLRRSELVAIDCAHVDWKRDGILITLPRSKTDQEGRGQLVAVRYGLRERTCPVRALKGWLQVAGITAGPVFRSVIHGRLGDRLSGKAVARHIKTMAKAAGLDPARFSGHSLRVGHVTQARENGADLATVQQQLRHKRIETTARYDRKPGLLRNSTSGKLGL